MPCDAGIVTSAAIQDIAKGGYRGKTEDQIQGSGHGVRSLEAALWCFVQTESFEDAVLKAVNLGDDADTTGAVCGQVAGAFYGESGIPDRWLQRLAMVAATYADGFEKQTEIYPYFTDRK